MKFGSVWYSGLRRYVAARRNGQSEAYCCAVLAEAKADAARYGQR